MDGKRLAVWGMCIASTLLAVIANAAVATYMEYNLFSLSYYVLIPIGAGILGCVAVSGYYIGMERYKLKSTGTDLVLLLCLAIAFVWLIYVFDYYFLILRFGTKVKEHWTLSQFITFDITQSRYKFGHGPGNNYGDDRSVVVGGAGWALLIPRIAILLVMCRQVHWRFKEKADGEW